MKTPTVYEIQSGGEWRKAGQALKALRPTLDVDSFVSRRAQLTNDGYRLVGVEIENEIVSVGSFTISPHALHGRELLIHDMATKKEFEGRGYAGLVLKFIESVAEAENCFRIFVHTRNAGGFYERNGYEKYSTGLIKIMKPI